MKTSCHSCIFAKTKYNVQNGCVVNRVEKFKKLEHRDEGFYILDGYCNCRRTDEWKHKDHHQRIEFLRKEIEISYDLFICQSSMEKALITLDSIEKLDIKPVTVNLLVPIEDTQDIIPVHKSVSHYPFKIQIVGFKELIHSTINKKCKNKYVMFLDDGKEVPNKPLKKLNYEVNDELHPILLYRDKDFTICSRFIYNQYCLAENPFQEIYEDLLQFNPKLVLTDE